MRTLRIYSLLLVAVAFIALPSTAAAQTVTVELTEIVIDRDEPGFDLALVGLLPKLEKAFPEAAGFHLIGSDRVEFDPGSTREVPFHAAPWKLTYFGKTGEHHRLEIETPKSRQIVRARPGATFFFAVTNQDGVVAVTVEPDRQDATRKPPVAHRSRNRPEATQTDWLRKVRIGRLVFGGLGLLGCGLIVLIARRTNR